MPRLSALLIGGDNLHAPSSNDICGAVSPIGAFAVRRVYADATTSAWTATTNMEIVHAGTGKNASDILLVLDAMELAATGLYSRIVLATSDGDFSHLAIRLRSKGIEVIGIGKRNAPAKLRDACSRFIDIACGRHKGVLLTELDRAVVAFLGGSGQSGVAVSVVGRVMGTRGLIMKDLKWKDWRTYLEAQDHLFEIDPKGPDARVRLRPGTAARA